MSILICQEDVVDALIAGGRNLERKAAESLALEGYRTGLLSDEQLRQLLGFESRLQVHGFLKDIANRTALTTRSTTKSARHHVRSAMLVRALAASSCVSEQK